MKFHDLISRILLEENKHYKFVIISGIHGDEPAGNYIAKHFLNRDDVLVIPDVNKTGKRRYHGVDLNRHFDTEDISPIQKHILSEIEKADPILVIDLHEDDHELDIYAYSSTEVKKQIQNALKVTEEHIPKYVHHDKTDLGVVTHGKRPHKHTLERALDKLGVSYCLIETPTKKELKRRITDGSKIVEAILKQF